MLADRHELDVGEPEIAGVGGKLVGQLRVAELSPPICPSPRAQVHLVDADGAVQRVALRALRHPVVVSPPKPEIPDLGCGLGWRLVVKAEWVRLVDPVPAVAYVVLVRGGVAGLGDEALPDARDAARLEDVRVRVPTVPVPDHRHPIGVGRPDGEVRSLGRMMRSQLLVEPEVGAFVPEVEIVVGETGRVVAGSRHRAPGRLWRLTPGVKRPGPARSRPP